MNSKPLSEKEARREQEKMDKEVARRRRESASEKAKQEMERAEDRKFIMELRTLICSASRASNRSAANQRGRSAANRNRDFGPEMPTRRCSPRCAVRSGSIRPSING